MSGVAPKIRVGGLFRIKESSGFLLCRVCKVTNDGWFNYEYWYKGQWRLNHGYI